MKYFKTSRWSPYITEVDVLRVTDKCVFTRGFRGGEDRHAIKSDGNAYYPTWDEAFEHVKSEKERAMKDAENRLSHARIEWTKVLALQDARHAAEAP